MAEIARIRILQAWEGELTEVDSRSLARKSLAFFPNVPGQVYITQRKGDNWAICVKTINPRRDLGEVRKGEPVTRFGLGDGYIVEVDYPETRKKG